MSSENKIFVLSNPTMAVIAGIGLIFVVLRYRAIIKHLRRNFDFRNPLRYKTITVINTQEECIQVIEALKKHFKQYSVVGFDCEWVTVGRTRRPIALLQLSSHKGMCALFRIWKMKQIPKELREILEDDKLIKVGVAPQDDAQKLFYDYGVGVASTFDIRFLAIASGYKPEGLAKMCKTHLNIELDKSWQLVCSDWEAMELSLRQLHYAANDALVAIELFKKLIGDKRSFWQKAYDEPTSFIQKIEPFVDVNFKKKYDHNNQKRNINPNNYVALSIKSSKKLNKAQQVRGLGTQTKVFYDNCWLEAPDGDLLCTIDRRKATWYLNQNLGSEVKSEPLTVRLNFEPAGRAIGEAGRYYQIPKENRCVVCGRRDAYIRKNVVPREYRKHFPDVMKSHTSHDIVLLCPNCHQISNISDLKIREKLATMCDAPFKFGDSAVKHFENIQLKKVRSAARALLRNREKIPADKVSMMEKIILDHFVEEKHVSSVLLEKAVNIEYKLENEDFCYHGAKVVQKYGLENGGLIELEKLWREHFLVAMRPKFMPDLWSVTHSENRLEVRKSEGRVNSEDLVLAGLETQPDFNKKKQKLML